MKKNSPVQNYISFSYNQGKKTKQTAKFTRIFDILRINTLNCLPVKRQDGFP